MISILRAKPTVIAPYGTYFKAALQCGRLKVKARPYPIRQLKETKTRKKNHY